MFISDQVVSPMNTHFNECLVSELSKFLKQYMILNGIADGVKSYCAF